MASPYSPTQDKVSDQAEGWVDKADETVRGAADKASDLADRAVDQGREVGAMVQKAPAAMRDALDTSLKQQPMATLAIASVIGFLLGAVWKS